ncbi:MAG: hypothetical protein QOE05_3787 [Actinomycetota bacterium]|nr:hypothetical protein [Actinomycetota bacterium]
MTADAAPPQLSPDGYWWWTGAEWVPAANLFAPSVPHQTERLQTEPVHAEPAQVEPVPAHVQVPAQSVQQYAPAEAYVSPVPAQQSWQPPVEEHAIPAQTQPVLQLPVFEILPAYAAAPDKKPSRLRATIAASTAAVVLAAAGAAFGVNHYLGGGGQQPEDVLPASSAAVVKIDLDPSLSQKAALYRLSRAFPMLQTRGQDTIKDDLLRPLFSNESMSYDKDVKPWLGDRAAVAAVPDGSADGFAPVAAVQYTDKDKAKRTLMTASARAATGDGAFFFAFSGDYVVIANTQAEADRYAGTQQHLSDNAAYTQAVDSLGADQIAVAWADLKRVYDGFPLAARQANPFFGNVKAAPTGAFVVGVHAASSYLEVQGKAAGVDQGLTQLGAKQLGRAKTANLVGTFPNDTVAAVEVSGLGEVVSKAYAALPPPVKEAANGLGLKMPGDLAAIVGSDTAVGLTGNLTAPTVIGHVRTPNPAAAVSALTRLRAKLGSDAPWCPCDGSPIVLRRDATGYTFSTDRSAKTTGNLGKTASFTRAVPDAKTAGMVVYFNVAALPPELLRSVDGLDAVGMSVNGATGEFRLRLTTR